MQSAINTSQKKISPFRFRPIGLTLYVGTYTNGKSEGIYICRMNTESAMIRLKGVKKGIGNPSFLIIDHNNSFLYSVNEASDYEGKKEGSISVFRIDDNDQILEFIDRQPSGGAAPCNLCIDQNNRNLMVSNYSSGNVAILPVLENGCLGRPIQFIQHEGSSIHPTRQTGPHPHSITLDTSNRFAFVTDLGLDKIMIYRYDPEKRSLSPAHHPFVQLVPGAGPRHFIFHPDGTKAYVVNELNSTLTAFDYDAKTGSLKESQTVTTLPTSYTGENECADIHIHPSGKFIYASNRGHDSIVVLELNEFTGEISVIQHQSTNGKTPRNFVIDPTTQFLLVANQDSDSIVVFTIDSETGKLSSTGHNINIPNPACLQFINSQVI